MEATIAAPIGTRARSSVRRGERPVRSARGAAAGPSILTAVLVAAIVAAFLAAVSALPTPADRPAPHASSRAVRVLPSDSLWSIAAANRAPDATTEETVRAIRALNRLSTSEVAAGALIYVPSPESSDAVYASR